MEKGMGILMIAGACLAVLFMVVVKRKAELFLNFCLRAVTGGIAIYGINLLLEKWEIPCSVGLNLISLLTSGTLGFSGVTLLYAVSAFHFL
jgi:inhibitor of the pro-sigma K processing machinery